MNERNAAAPLADLLAAMTGQARMLRRAGDARAADRTLAERAFLVRVPRFVVTPPAHAASLSDAAELDDVVRQPFPGMPAVASIPDDLLAAMLPPFDECAVVVPAFDCLHALVVAMRTTRDDHGRGLCLRAYFQTRNTWAPTEQPTTVRMPMSQWTDAELGDVPAPAGHRRDMTSPLARLKWFDTDASASRGIVDLYNREHPDRAAEWNREARMHHLLACGLALYLVLYLGSVAPPVRHVTQSKRANAKRRRRGKRELSDYHVIDLPSPRSDAPAAAAGGRAPARFHAVRAHPRRLTDGRHVWVRPHYRGSIEAGLVRADYRLRVRRPTPHASDK